MTFPGHGKLAESWWGATVPPTRVTLSAINYVGARFQVTVPGRIFGARVYVDTADTLDHWAILWNQDIPQGLAAKAMTGIQKATPGWQQLWFRPTIRVATGVNYALVWNMRSAYYRTTGNLASPVTHGNISYVKGFQTTSIDPLEASLSLVSNSNGVDLLFQAD
jgi:hypothetical protein